MRFNQIMKQKHPQSQNISNFAEIPRDKQETTVKTNLVIQTKNYFCCVCYVAGKRQYLIKAGNITSSCTFVTVSKTGSVHHHQCLFANQIHNI